VHQSFKMATKMTKVVITKTFCYCLFRAVSALQHITNGITDTVLELLKFLAKILSTQMS